MAAVRTFPSFVFSALLTQHLLAVAAPMLLQRSTCRRCGHSSALIWLESRPSFRCIRFRQTRRGQTGLVQIRRMLTQKTFAYAAEHIRRRREFHQISHSIGSKLAKSKPSIRCTQAQQSRRGLVVVRSVVDSVNYRLQQVALLCRNG